MAKFLSNILIERKEDKGLDKAQALYKKIAQHSRYKRFKDEIDGYLITSDNDDIIVELD